MVEEDIALADERSRDVHPPTLKTAVPKWKASDTIPLGRRTLRGTTVRDDDEADQPPAPVVDKPRLGAGRATSCTP